MPVADPHYSTFLTAFGFGTVLLLLLALGLVWFVTNYQRRLLEQRARARELEADLQRQVLEATFRTQEEERRRIARDLHDDVGTTLAALKNLVFSLGPQSADVRDVVEVLDDVVQRVRTISGQLMPATLEKFGLARALAALAAQLDALTPDTRVAFASEPPDTEPASGLSKSAELLLYRVAQELLGNAIKHAAASRIDLRLVRTAGQLTLEVADDGRGFDYAAARHRPASNQPGGLGLLSLESRVHSLHGELAVDSTAAGTRIRVVIGQTG